MRNVRGLHPRCRRLLYGQCWACGNVRALLHRRLRVHRLRNAWRWLRHACRLLRNSWRRLLRRLRLHHVRRRNHVFRQRLSCRRLRRRRLRRHCLRSAWRLRNVWLLRNDWRLLRRRHRLRNAWLFYECKTPLLRCVSIPDNKEVRPREQERLECLWSGMRYHPMTEPPWQMVNPIGLAGGEIGSEIVLHFLWR